jgi:hypothetical protein
MAAWTDLHDLVLPEVMGVSPEQATFYLRLAAIDFCESTMVHSVEFDPIDVVVNQSVYTPVSPAAATELHKVRSLWVNDKKLDFAPMDAIGSWHTDWRTLADPQPKAFTQYDMTSVVLLPTPTVGYVGGMRLFGAVRPTTNAAEVADLLVQDYRETIAKGAKYRLYAQMGKPWSNPAESIRLRAEFGSDVANTKIEVSKSFTRATLRVAPRRFA